jgi:hypothetical protein
VQQGLSAADKAADSANLGEAKDKRYLLAVQDMMQIVV